MAKVMNEYDEGKIGKLLAWSGDNNVYEYDTDYVIKFSKFDHIMNTEDALNAKEMDFEIVSTYLKNFTVETEIVCDPGKKVYAFLQRRINGAPLRKDNLHDAQIRKQFAEFADGYKKALGAGHPPIDLLGGYGVRGTSLSNIFLTQDNTLVQIDYFTMDWRRFPAWSQVLLRPLFALGYRWQERRIRKFLNEPEH